MTCRALAGEIVLTNGPPLELDSHWRVEHGHPVAIPGWLVLVLRRHARSLHELTDEESTTLGRWLGVLPKALHHATGSDVEYVMQFAEARAFTTSTSTSSPAGRPGSPSGRGPASSAPPGSTSRSAPSGSPRS